MASPLARAPTNPPPPPAVPAAPRVPQAPRLAIPQAGPRPAGSGAVLGSARGALGGAPRGSFTGTPTLSTMQTLGKGIAGASRINLLQMQQMLGRGSTAALLGGELNNSSSNMAIASSLSKADVRAAPDDQGRKPPPPAEKKKKAPELPKVLENGTRVRPKKLVKRLKGGVPCDSSDDEVFALDDKKDHADTDKQIGVTMTVQVLEEQLYQLVQGQVDDSFLR